MAASRTTKVSNPQMTFLKNPCSLPGQTLLTRPIPQVVALPRFRSRPAQNTLNLAGVKFGDVGVEGLNVS